MKKSHNPVIGEFTGKCCDADVVNHNGQYLDRDLFNNIINSEEYETAIENGYYIGFLGHPEDPGCQDFKDACIVMTSMEMKDNGDVYGSFSLIDTPVGRVVKAFTDAGVKFGISIRGVGDVSNSGTVDPDTFLFRGFDLVTFPAYDDCVPEFRAIAASTDVEQQKKYKKVCASVQENLSAIESSEALEIIKDQFNENSEEYSNIEDRITEVSIEPVQVAERPDTDTVTDVFMIPADLEKEVLQQKVDALTKLYVEQVQKNKNLLEVIANLRSDVCCAKRVNKRIKRITASQYKDMNNKFDSMSSQIEVLGSKITDLESNNSDLRRQLVTATKKLKRAEDNYNSVEANNKQLIEANQNTRKEIGKLIEDNNTITNRNLLLKKKIEASESLEADHKSEVESLKAQLRETVTANESLTDNVSNLEAENKTLQSTIEANEQTIFDYQQVCADKFAYEAGVTLDKIPVTASTTAKELKDYIYGKASYPYMNNGGVSGEIVPSQDDGPVCL